MQLRHFLPLLLLPLLLCTPGLTEDDKMPPMAPPIQRDGEPLLPGPLPKPAPQASERSGPRDVATFVRRPTSPSNVPLPEAPLLGNVSRAQALAGRANYLVPVPPGVRAGVNVDVPAGVFRAWLERSHPDFALKASRIASTDIVETKGQWDNAGKALRKMGIESTTIRGGALRDYPLDHTKVLIINCPGNVPRDCFQRIRDFVAGGGYLVSTDWALDNMLQKTFPGYVEWNRKQNGHDFYEAEVSDPDPVLCRYTVAQANWKLDRECHLLTVLKPNVVRVVVRSRALAHEDGEGVLAVTFPFGRGQVLHLVGHFDNNPGAFHFGDSLPDPAPVIGISLRQAIAANFVIAGLSTTHIPER